MFVKHILSFTKNMSCWFVWHICNKRQNASQNVKEWVCFLMSSDYRFYCYGVSGTRPSIQWLQKSEIRASYSQIDYEDRQEQNIAQEYSINQQYTILRIEISVILFKRLFHDKGMLLIISKFVCEPKHHDKLWDLAHDIDHTEIYLSCLAL